MQVVLNFEKRHLVFLVVLACILFVVGVSAYVNPVTHVGHPANETGPGTFGAGDYVFPGNLNVNGNFGVNGNVWAVGNLYANNGAATFWWREGEGEVLRLNGVNPAQNIHLQNINGNFRLVDHAFAQEIFRVTQIGQAIAKLSVSAPNLCFGNDCRTSWPSMSSLYVGSCEVAGGSVGGTCSCRPPDYPPGAMIMIMTGNSAGGDGYCEVHNQNTLSVEAVCDAATKLRGSVFACFK